MLQSTSPSFFSGYHPDCTKSCFLAKLEKCKLTKSCQMSTELSDGGKKLILISFQNNNFSLLGVCSAMIYDAIKYLFFPLLLSPLSDNKWSVLFFPYLESVRGELKESWETPKIMINCESLNSFLSFFSPS